MTDTRKQKYLDVVIGFETCAYWKIKKKVNLTITAFAIIAYSTLTALLVFIRLLVVTSDIE